MAARLPSALLRTQTDRRLTALAAQGSEAAFEALVERYRRPLQAFCRRMLLDDGTAEDVVQQAFLSTWQALARGTPIADMRSWLYRVVHNGAVNALKRSGYRYEELSEALGGADAPDEDLDRRIAVRRTLAGLAELPELQREALLRTAVEGRSHEEVARELGVSDDAVRGLVYRARVALRAAATALTPAPLATWAATVASGRATAPVAERIGEIVAGGGGAGAVSSLLLKGGATVAATGALAGGAVVAERATDRERPAAGTAPATRADARADRPRTDGVVPDAAATGLPVTARTQGPAGGAAAAGADPGGAAAAGTDPGGERRSRGAGDRDAGDRGDRRRRRGARGGDRDGGRGRHGGDSHGRDRHHGDSHGRDRHHGDSHGRDRHHGDSHGGDGHRGDGRRGGRGGGRDGDDGADQRGRRGGRGGARRDDGGRGRSGRRGGRDDDREDGRHDVVGRTRGRDRRVDAARGGRRGHEHGDERTGSGSGSAGDAGRRSLAPDRPDDDDAGAGANRQGGSGGGDAED